MKYTILFCCLAFVVPFTSCKEEWVRNITFDKEKFDSERTKWQQKKPRKYSFELEASYTSLPLDPVKLTVLNDSLVSAVYLPIENRDMSNESMYIWKGINTIDDIFMQFEKEFAQDSNDEDVVFISLTIDYDTVYHFPKKAHYSISKKSYPNTPATIHGNGKSHTLGITNFRKL